MARSDYTVGKLQIESDVMNNVQSMTCNMTGEDWDITAIGDENPSMEDITETFEIQFTANYDGTNAAQVAMRNKFVGGSRTLTSVAYYTTDSTYISGSGLITACSIVTSVGSFDQMQGTIRSAGTWTYT